MSRRTATLLAIAATVLVYTAIAWLVTAITIPPGVPTAAAPWLRPFRVIAALGLAISTPLHLPHLAGQFLAAILLGSVLGAVFATSRYWLDR